MTHEGSAPQANRDLCELSQRLSTLLDSDPAKAVREARQIDVNSSERLAAMSVLAAILVDGGAATQQQDAIEEGLELFRAVYAEVPKPSVAYDLANALVAVGGSPPQGSEWIDHQERTRKQRAEARQLYWRVAQDETAAEEFRTQAWTDIANLFSHSYRLGEAHDARLAALHIDPSNGVAAALAAPFDDPPPLFAMFNVLKADFILARDLAWRATSEAAWPTTGRFADTLDYAIYGPDASALVLAHRTALDLFDKIAATVNHYFELGQAPNKIYFGRMRRESSGKKAATKPLTSAVEKAIRGGAYALYGLMELAEDYDSENGILRPQKNFVSPTKCSGHFESRGPRFR